MSRDPVFRALQREKKQRVLSETLEMFIRKFQPKELHKQPEFCNELYYLMYHAGDVAAEPFRDIVQDYAEAASRMPPRNPEPEPDDKATGPSWFPNIIGERRGSDPEAEGERIVEGLTAGDAVAPPAEPKLADATLGELAAAYVTRSDESYAEFFNAVTKRTRDASTKDMLDRDAAELEQPHRYERPGS